MAPATPSMRSARGSELPSVLLCPRAECPSIAASTAMPTVARAWRQRRCPSLPSRVCSSRRPLPAAGRQPCSGKPVRGSTSALTSSPTVQSLTLASRRVPAHGYCHESRPAELDGPGRGGGCPPVVCAALVETARRSHLRWVRIVPAKKPVADVKVRRYSA